MDGETPSRYLYGFRLGVFSYPFCADFNGVFAGLFRRPPLMFFRTPGTPPYPFGKRTIRCYGNEVFAVRLPSAASRRAGGHRNRVVSERNGEGPPPV